MFFAPLPVLLESPLFAYLPSFDRFQIEIENFAGIAAVRGGQGRGSGVIFTRPNYRTARNELAGGDMFHSGIVLHAELRPETITTIGLRFVKRRAANILLFRVKGKLHFDSFLKHDNWA